MLKLFATSTSTGEREEITDLYWFEENGIRAFDGEGRYVLEAEWEGHIIPFSAIPINHGRIAL